jgi:septum formation protein
MLTLSKKLILASNSPRRKEILSQAGFQFEVKVKEIEEIYPPEILDENVPEFLAHLKAKAFESEIKNEIVITADTVVLLNKKILGKPKDQADAKNMLKAMSANVHRVVSGVCIMTKNELFTFSDFTDVHFKKLTDSEIDFYIQTYKPFDKAGAYGIQEWIGMIGIEKIVGSYYNVMGLPIHIVYKQLERYRINS